MKINYNFHNNDLKKTVITLNKRRYIIKWFAYHIKHISKLPNGHTRWYKTGRGGSTGVGYTLESAFGKPEDNLQRPDLAPKGLKKCIELKAHDTVDSSPVTLFTKSPGAPRKANDLIRKRYGYTTPESHGLKICHTSVFERGTCNKKSGNNFKVINDKKRKKVIIAIGPVGHEKNAASWSYDRLNKAITSKIKLLAIVNAEHKTVGKNKYYRYFPNAIIMTHFTLRDFLNALDNNDAFIDLRIGVYMSGELKGSTHDHGTGFRMTLPNVMYYAHQSGHTLTLKNGHPILLTKKELKKLKELLKK